MKMNRRTILALLSMPCLLTEAFNPIHATGMLQRSQTARSTPSIHGVNRNAVRRDGDQEAASLFPSRTAATTQRSRSGTRMQAMMALPPPVTAFLSSTFATYGTIPLWKAFSLNAVLFTIALPKLQSVLTPTGIAHAMFLGTGLWATLGWRGWTQCVAYLLFGQLVTKVKFAEKEKKGIAEGRGGRRGPENVWYALSRAVRQLYLSWLIWTASVLLPQALLLLLLLLLLCQVLLYGQRQSPSHLCLANSFLTSTGSNLPHRIHLLPAIFDIVRTDVRGTGDPPRQALHAPSARPEPKESWEFHHRSSHWASSPPWPPNCPTRLLRRSARPTARQRSSSLHSSACRQARKARSPWKARWRRWSVER